MVSLCSPDFCSRPRARPIYGSGRSGVGIAEVDGVTVVVKVVHGNPQVLGPLP